MSRDSGGSSESTETAVADWRAKVVEAQAQVPLAMAEGFRTGRVGVMDD